ncbi:MAG: cysteine peptidase family C39 domain-containing protein, partial [Kofleriaceae bacterium]
RARMTRYETIPRTAIKIDLPNTCQREDHTCGPAALMAICAYFGVGPDDEARCATDMRIDRDGSDPEHLVRAAKKYGLSHREYRGMTLDQLADCLDQRRPVMLTLQAWGEGHWVVAIGYDHRRIYFEDPYLDRGRGFIDRSELVRRWHDVEGPKSTELRSYGLALWKPRPRFAARCIPE